MELQDIRVELKRRCYRWVLSEWEREIRQSFPLLRGMESEWAYRVLAFVEHMSDDEAHAFGVAAAHVTMPTDDRAALDIVPTAAEKSLHDAYVKSFLYARDPVPEALGRSKHAKKNSRALHKALAERLAFLGTPTHVPRELAYFTPLPVGSCQVVTSADYSVAFNGFDLRQVAIAKPPPARVRDEWLLWYGQFMETLGVGKTEIIVVDGDVATAADTAARLADHFLQACPKLLDGLDWVRPEATGSA